MTTDSTRDAEESVETVGYTKGVWKARNQKSKSGEDLGWIIEVDGERGGRIGWSSRAFADTNKEEDRGGPQTKANAHLMAAALDLYEALLVANSELLSNVPNFEDWEAAKQIRDAIAKAEARNG